MKEKKDIFNSFAPTLTRGRNHYFVGVADRMGGVRNGGSSKKTTKFLDKSTMKFKNMYDFFSRPEKKDTHTLL